MATDELNRPAVDWKLWGQILLLILGVYLFLVSIGLLGASFKLFGKDLADLTSRSRMYAIAYIVLAFYALPFALLLVWR